MVKKRVCSVPTHSGFQATSNLRYPAILLKPVGAGVCDQAALQRSKVGNGFSRLASFSSEGERKATFW